MDLAPLADCALSDLGNAQRFGYWLKDKLHYCDSLGWMAYKDGRWLRESQNVALAAAKEVAHRIAQEASFAPQNAGYAKWAEKSSSFTAIMSMLRLAKAEPGILVRPDLFDTHLSRFVVGNGVLDFESDAPFALLRHRPSDYSTKRTPIHFDANSSAPLWRAHLERVLPDKDVRDYVQRVLGYCLLGTGDEQLLFVFKGGGQNGKSKTVNVMRRVLGEYGATMDIRVLIDTTVQKGGDLASPQLASMSAVRLVCLAEPPKNAPLNETLVKTLTGGNTLRLRHMRQNSFEMTPRFVPVIECNHDLKFERSFAMQRRIRTVPWHATIPEDQRDLKIEEKLMAEAPGILVWMLEGLREYKGRGLSEPRAVLEASGGVKGGAYGDWFDERIIRDGTAEIDLRDLQSDFDFWANASGLKKAGQGRLSDYLEAVGGKRLKQDSVTRRERFGGIALNASGQLRNSRN